MSQTFYLIDEKFRSNPFFNFHSNLEILPVSWRKYLGCDFPNDSNNNP